MKEKPIKKIDFKNQKKLSKTLDRVLDNSWISKNIIRPKKKNWTFLENFTKFFIKIVLWLVIPNVVLKNKSKTNELIDRTYYKFSSKDFKFIPTSTAFYLLISFVPIVSMLILLLSIIPDYNHIFIESIINKIMPGVSSLFKIANTNKINATAAYTTLAILFISSIWLSSSGFSKFIYSQNYIYGHQELGNWLINKLKGILIVIGIVLYLFVAFAFYIFIYNAFSHNITSNAARNTFFYTTFIVFSFFSLYLGIGILYKVSPSFKVSWSMINPGILITVIPMVIFIAVFGSLMSLIDYGKYGLVGIFMYIAMFVGYSTYFIYLGIVANEAYYKTFFSSRTIAKKKWFY